MDFDACTYFDCRGDETLKYETPEEAIRDLLDVVCDPAQPIEAAIAAVAPLTVTGYMQMEVSEAERDRLARQLMERLCEDYDEQYGSTDDPDIGKPEADQLLAVYHLCGVAVDELCRLWPVWRCNPAAKRVYTAEEITALMRNPPKGKR